MATDWAVLVWGSPASGAELDAPLRLYMDTVGQHLDARIAPASKILTHFPTPPTVRVLTYLARACLLRLPSKRCCGEARSVRYGMLTATGGKVCDVPHARQPATSAARSAPLVVCRKAPDVAVRGVRRASTAKHQKKGDVKRAVSEPH